MLCVVCKKLWVPGSAHSFHKFPRDSNRRQKWMEIVGISKITSNASVCSDHFTPESYHQTDGYTTVKRLLSTAEPIIDKGIQVLRDVTINATTNRPSEHQSTSCLEYFMNTSGDKQKDAIVDHCTTTNSINDNHTTTDDTATNLSEKGLLTRIHSGNNVINKIIEKQGCSVNNTSDSNQSQNVNRVESNRSKKRNIVNDQESCSNKRFRFMDGYLVKTISRHDFTTDKAWETFMRYVTIQRNKHVINRRKILRKQNKVKSFQDLIDNLKAKETEAAAKYLECIPETIKQLIVRMKEKKRTAPFPSALKNFARTLHFHSPAAYEKVRSTFLKCLPAIETLNKWYSSKDYKPGISEEIIKNISQIVNTEAKNGKKLVFNITFDEMSIKRWTNYCLQSHKFQGLVDLGGQLKVDATVKDGDEPKSEQKASKALVFMLVNINGGFKTPVAYYFTNSLTGNQKSILLKDLLCKLHENNINVVSVTFDGDE